MPATAEFLEERISELEVKGKPSSADRNVLSLERQLEKISAQVQENIRQH